MEELVKRVCEAYKSDPTCPSVVVSLLPNGSFYASVVRYTKPIGGGKTVVCNARKDTLEDTIATLTASWHTLTEG